MADSVRELKARLRSAGISDADIAGMTEKSELIELVRSLEASSMVQHGAAGSAAESADNEGHELQFTLALSAVTCCIPAISCFYRSEDWKMATVAFFERYCSAFVDSGVGSGRSAEEVYIAYRRLIDKLMRQHLLLLEHAPDLATLALFCELVGASDVLDDDWVEADVAEQAKLMLLCDDEARFAELMREYATLASDEPEDTLADLEDTYGFALLFPQPLSPPESAAVAEAPSAAATVAEKAGPAAARAGSAGLDGGGVECVLMPSASFASFTQVQQEGLADDSEREVVSSPVKSRPERAEAGAVGRGRASSFVEQVQDEPDEFRRALAQARSIIAPGRRGDGRASLSPQT